ncbi:hypothetical protein D7X33_47595 [Butyricicoccus sp. 1XD8-22]|nr:hypothetical protein D7X33_47595 [Butyricicoccus sp. 1XD8-22]
MASGAPFALLCGVSPLLFAPAGKLCFASKAQAADALAAFHSNQLLFKIISSKKIPFFFE